MKGGWISLPVFTSYLASTASLLFDTKKGCPAVRAPYPSPILSNSIHKTFQC